MEMNDYFGEKVSDFEYYDLLSYPGTKLLIPKGLKGHICRFFDLITLTKDSDDLSIAIDKDAYFSKMNIETKSNLVFNAAHIKKSSDERYSVNGSLERYQDLIYVNFAESYIHSAVNGLSLLNKSLKDISSKVCKKEEIKEEKTQENKGDSLISKLGWSFE
ncbi:MAG: hypothetical protein ACP5NZ_04375 [Nanobdellota archaeon]